MTDSDAQYLLARVTPGPGGCWLWTGPRHADGYGYAKRARGTGSRRVHRMSHETFIGPIPEGLDVDHECHNLDPTCLGGPACWHRRCIRPDHLIARTRRANVLASGTTIASRYAARAACSQGHEFTPANTIVRIYRNGQKARLCRICERRRLRDYKRARRARLRAEAA